MKDNELRGSFASKLTGGASITWGLLAVVLALGLGRLLYGWAASHFDRRGTATLIPRGRLPAPDSSANGQDAPADQRCSIPELPEGPGRVDISLNPNIPVDSVGGMVEQARYRIVGAYAKEDGFTPGRWSMSFDLGAAGQGAFYRQLGLSRQASRIRWSTRNHVFSYETVCPDPGESMDFPYSVRDGKLFITTRDALVLVLEPYAPSEISELP